MCFFKNADRVHAVFRTPYVALLYSGVWSCILVLSGTFDILTDMVVFNGFAFYALLAFGLIRMKRANIIREKVPGHPLSAILFILFTLILLLNTLFTNPPRTLTGIALILSGVPVYYLFKMKKSGQ